ncbi:MAG: biotin--[acetyl-CoA-carboxylase] ligase [Flavitalea sp.]
MSYPPTFDTIGQPFILLTTVDSTNNYAMAKVHEGAGTHGTVYFALDQTAGKGQRGKTWKSIPGQNIMMSVIIDPGTARTDQSFMMSCVISLACYDFYKSFAGDETSIKWPNDIYWRDRKAGGILIENVFSSGGSRWKCSIAGTGLNVNQTDFGEIGSRAVSLRQITGKQFEVTEAGKTLCGYISHRLRQFYEHRFEELLDDFNAALFMRNQKVKLRKGPVVFETTILGADQTGKLMVKDTIERSFASGEVIWVFDND